MFNAIYRGDAKEVLRRLDAGPTLLEARGTGSVQTTPLMYAASVGRLQIVQLLTGKGANLEATSRHGRTVLHHAAESGHEEVVAYLLENGVHSHRQDSSGLTAMMLALDKRHVRVALLLLEHMKGQGLEARKKGWTHTALHEAVCMEEEEVVACLLRHGARADSRTYRRITPLHYAASRGSLGIVRRLLKHVAGQGLNARNIQGSTALDFAVFSDRVENIKALLLAGADPTITDNQGETSRAVAERRNFPCAPVFRWWDGELERRSLLHRARALHDADTQHQEAPTLPVPGYMQARVGAGLALPRLEVVVGSQKRAGGEEQQQEEEMHAMVGWVVGEVSEELFTELLQGFHTPHTPRNEG